MTYTCKRAAAITPRAKLTHSERILVWLRRFGGVLSYGADSSRKKSWLQFLTSKGCE